MENFMSSINEQIKHYMTEHRDVLSRGDETQELCFDGIVDESTYFQQNYRVCFLLKETNITNPAEKRDWDYANWLNYNQLQGKNVNLYKTYHNACMWIAELYDIMNGNDIKYSDYTYTQTEDGSLDLKKVRPELAKVAFVNLKKTWGGPSTQWKDLNAYINDKIDKQWVVNKDIQNTLKYEMSLLKPKIVICGSQEVYDFARNIFGVERDIVEITETNAFESNGMLFVKFRHPACRGKRKDQFEYAKKIFDEIVPILNK